MSNSSPQFFIAFSLSHTPEKTHVNLQPRAIAT
jgi:hypothetical protein